LTMPISQKVWIAQGWQKFPSAGLWAFR
jgi:hypothetical protein